MILFFSCRNWNFLFTKWLHSKLSFFFQWASSWWPAATASGPSAPATPTPPASARSASATGASATAVARFSPRHRQYATMPPAPTAPWLRDRRPAPPPARAVSCDASNAAAKSVAAPRASNARTWRRRSELGGSLRMSRSRKNAALLAQCRRASCGVREDENKDACEWLIGCIVCVKEIFSRLFLYKENKCDRKGTERSWIIFCTVVT